ncbi:hypothetical protein Ahy_A07g031782 [Arachis hypogaea]|uniref:Uncharacterized protein n=1 Tax=Arachis hypogaea TaxID=3818 RepID=A0A445C506_ARAHY|nr:hypothetical protein Ahy_A07g031782 [Arachis hypogaea]
MGKSILSAVRFHELCRIVSSSANGNAKRTATAQKQQPQRMQTNTVAVPSLKHGKMGTSEGQCRMPLSRVVADCTNRWFHDTLKEAKAGDTSMQLLVAQMYFSGYGVPKDPQKCAICFVLPCFGTSGYLIYCDELGLKGNVWIDKAARSRNSVWKACDKHIGYRTSDSDSYGLENDAK